MNLDTFLEFEGLGTNTTVKRVVQLDKLPFNCVTARRDRTFKGDKVVDCKFSQLHYYYLFRLMEHNRAYTLKEFDVLMGKAELEVALSKFEDMGLIQHAIDKNGEMGVKFNEN